MGTLHKLYGLGIVIFFLFATKLILSSALQHTEIKSKFQDDHISAKVLNRVARSPQLFSGRKNVLSDLTQLKPPTLNDLNEFRQKMASLANMTAILEHAIAAEKTARTTMQSFVNAIKDQILGIQRAVNPDPENYWAESTICGGILVSQTGKISYKPNEYYKNNERCTWTVRANYRSKIRVTLTKGDFEKIHDYVAVTELDSSSILPNTEWNTKKLTIGQTVLFEGPLILVSFVSDGSIRRKGFKLDFEGMGSTTSNAIVYQHFHFSESMGQFDSTNLGERLREAKVNLSEDQLLVATLVVSPSNWDRSELRFSIPQDTLDLGGDDCAKTNLGIFTDFIALPHGVSHVCCGGKCDKEDFVTQSGIIMGILKLSEVTEKSRFQINWSTDTNGGQLESVNECGGILFGNFGKISYKQSSAYDDNERCLWLIHADSMKEGEIKVQLVKDGFEQHYDYVSLAYLIDDKNISFHTEFLYKSGAPVRVPSSFVLIEFYSDSATFGKPTGFELIWEIKYTRNNPMNVELEYISNQGSGNKVVSCSSQQTENNVKYISVISSQQNAPNQLLEIQTEQTFGPNGVSLFVSEKGNFSKQGNGLNSYQSGDGIAILMRKCTETSEDVSVNWKTKTVEAKDSIDSQLYAKSEDQCGDLLFGDSGQILYKIGKEYNVNEKCTWVIRSKRFSTITVQLMADGFESCCDGVQINKIISADGTIDPEGVAISRENRFHTLETTALLVTFFSDHSVTGTGFVLEFQTKGDAINAADGNIDLKHRQVKLESRPTPVNPFGPIFIETSSDNLLSIDTFHFQHVEIAIANTSVELKMENLQIDTCNRDSIALYHMPAIGKYETLKKIPKTELCTVERLVGGNPLTSFLTSEHEVVQPRGILVAVTKILQGKSDKSVSLKFE